MVTAINKLANGKVEIIYDDSNRDYILSGSNPLIKRVNSHGAVYLQIIMPGLETLQVDVSTLVTINAANAPAGLEARVTLLLDEVFRFGGGNGVGVAEVFEFTEQPQNALVPSGTDLNSKATKVLLFVDFVGTGATIDWVGSTDGGVTFPFGPYVHTKYFLINADNAPGWYRANVTYKGTVYHSDVAEVLIME